MKRKAIEVAFNWGRPLAEVLLFGDLADGGDVRIILKDDDTLDFVLTPNTRKLEHLSASKSTSAPESESD